MSQKGCVLGDGTAPPGWPHYGAYGADQVRCKYEECGHLGSLLTSPTKMECGTQCACSCCRLLAGEQVHGLTIGR